MAIGLELPSSLIFLLALVRSFLLPTGRLIGFDPCPLPRKHGGALGRVPAAAIPLGDRQPDATIAMRNQMPSIAGLALTLASMLPALRAAENPILPDGARLEVLHTRQVRLNSGLTEGPAVAPDGTIYFTDMPFGTDNGMILRYDPKTSKVTVFTDNSGKSNGLAFLSDGSMVSCDGADGGGRRLIRWDVRTGQGATLLDRFIGRRFNSPNDLCVDLKGRIYFTDPRYGGTEPRELEREAVYRRNLDGSVEEITRAVEKPNGIVLSPDQKTLYVGDHNNGGNRLRPTDPEPKRGAMKVLAFALDGAGKVSGAPRTLVNFAPENGCDGMTVDTAGNVYLACRSLARPGVMVVDPSGRELAFVETGH